MPHKKLKRTKETRVEGGFVPVSVTWLWLWGTEVVFSPVSHFFLFLKPSVVFIRPETFSRQKQRLQKWWFYALWTLLLKASFCCDANRNLKLANGLMGRMSSEVITLPDGQKLWHTLFCHLTSSTPYSNLLEMFVLSVCWVWEFGLV